MMTPEQFEIVNNLVNQFTFTGKVTTELLSDPIYDQRVQDVLDQYWPGTTDLTEIKGGDDIVYTAMYENEKVIVKSTPYNEKTYNQTLLFKDFLNFM
jgi:hypothetical protein